MGKDKPMRFPFPARKTGCSPRENRILAKVQTHLPKFVRLTCLGSRKVAVRDERERLASENIT